MANTWQKVQLKLSSGDVVEAQAPIIVSASRSTDIPAFYTDWFIERLKAGYLKWTNPFNGKPLYVSFNNTRLIVFWSKNPQPLLAKLDEVDKYCSNYYFQFTMNDYDKELIEPRVPALENRIETFKQLSQRLGKDRVIWRFDPLILTNETTPNVLLEKVQRLGDIIAPFTSRLVFSFVDINSYRKVDGNLKRGGILAREFTASEMEDVAGRIGQMVKDWGITAGTCGEIKDLDRFGIEHNRCIDDRLIVKEFSHDEELMRFVGATYKEPDLFSGEPGGWVPGNYRKDTGQREACGCIQSKDIGEYNTCPHLCHYCYANANNASAIENWKRHCACPHTETITGK